GQTFDRQQGTRGNTDTGREATVDLREYLGECVDARRRRGGNADLIDTLLAFRWEGRALPPEEVVSNLYLMVIGGTETLPKVFAGALYQLWCHPEQRAEVVANPGLAADAFWEALRYEMPTLMLGATAEADTTICGGTTVLAGQKLMHLWCAANRDEREFPEPERFDIHRRAPRILSFNHARHRCLGAHVAQMEGRVLLRELLSRIPDYEVDEAQAVRIRSEFFRGFSSLPIRFAARPAR
ncbi:MAG: cytochrome P450, partial [Myxococcales bacterium]|nr:cytochrome P450 [Myxococcales bacterium]